MRAQSWLRWYTLGSQKVSRVALALCELITEETITFLSPTALTAELAAPMGGGEQLQASIVSVQLCHLAGDLVHSGISGQCTCI